jgi:hypothetical protein
MSKKGKAANARGIRMLSDNETAAGWYYVWFRSSEARRLALTLLDAATAGKPFVRLSRWSDKFYADAAPRGPRQRQSRAAIAPGWCWEDAGAPCTAGLDSAAPGRADALLADRKDALRSLRALRKRFSSPMRAAPALRLGVNQT